MRALFTCVLACAAASVSAQDVLIRNAALHTASERGVLEGTDVLLRNGKIAAIGARLATPVNASVLDAEGRPVTAGLFGGLSAIGVAEVPLESTTMDAALLLGAPAYEMQWRPEFDVSSAFNPRASTVDVARVEGVTWAMLAPMPWPGSNFMAGQGAAVVLDGRFDALLADTNALFINLGGEMNGASAGSRAAQWMLLEQAVQETRQPDVNNEHALLHPQGRAALARYLRGGRVVFNVSRAADIRRAVAFAKKHGFKPIIARGVEAWLVADELARERVPVIIDPLDNLPSSFDTIGARLDTAALLHRAGVQIAFTQFGDPDNTHNARKIRQLAGNAVAHGLPHDAAIAALTANPAQIFGVNAERGRISVGQAADLVLWSGDPLEVTTVAEQVWIAGRAIEMRSRQTELRDRYFERLKR